ncbi:MAG: flgG [Myxococcaceae bacterium]|nr:flgG [Myxococcaceae bacterium]
MADGIYTALTGSLAQQHALDTIATNVANANTTGFRGDRVVFGELLAGSQKNQNVDPRQPAPLRADKFVRVDQNQLDSTSGMLRPTGNTLDVGIHGEGFFTVHTPQGDRLTRSGNFMLNANGEISTQDGYPVIGDGNQPIVIPRNTKSIEITTDGVVRADNVDIARFALKRVSDPTRLVREGTTNYAVTKDTSVTTMGTQLGKVQVMQGHLEASNVNPIAGLNELITVNRSFDALQKVIESFQNIDQRAARDIASRT